MKTNFLTIQFILVSCHFVFSQGIDCFNCAYIQGSKDHDSNPDCLANVPAKIVHMEDGLFCLTAKGRTADGSPFILRRAFSVSQGRDSFPKGQEALSCQQALKYGNREITEEALAVTMVGDQTVQQLTSCFLCNDKDECNSEKTSLTYEQQRDRPLGGSSTVSSASQQFKLNVVLILSALILIHKCF